MRAVWSFWSKPLEEGCGWRWSTPTDHLLAWGLSLQLARRHYERTTLITDTPGKVLLVDALGLEFTEVTIDLDALAGEDPALWALGKLVAYGLQDEPFVHLDADVFLWRPLPTRLLAAPVLAQHPERFHLGDEGGAPGVLEDAFARHRLDLPAEWDWARSLWHNQLGQPNCGIVGGSDYEFIRYYSSLALNIVRNPRHAAVWSALNDKQSLNVIVEQFMLAACVEFHRSHPHSPFKGVHLRYLFPSGPAAFDRSWASRVGFTHLLAEAKRDPRVAHRLRERTRREDRAFYRRCVDVAGGV